MSKYKIVVYAICKNEEVNIDMWYSSMKEADEIIVPNRSLLTISAIDGTIIDRSYGY